MAPLKFAALSSEIDLPFYAALASLKINHDKLDDSPRKVLGQYELSSTADPSTSCRIQIQETALTGEE